MDWTRGAALCINADGRSFVGAAGFMVLVLVEVLVFEMQ